MKAILFSVFALSITAAADPLVCEALTTTDTGTETKIGLLYNKRAGGRHVYSHENKERKISFSALMDGPIGSPAITLTITDEANNHDAIARGIAGNTVVTLLAKDDYRYDLSCAKR